MNEAGGGALQRARSAAVLTVLLAVAHGAVDAAGPIFRVLSNPVRAELCLAVVQLLQLSLLLSLVFLGVINACIFAAFELVRRFGWAVREGWRTAAMVVADYGVLALAFLGVEYYDSRVHSGTALFGPITGYLFVLALLFLVAPGLRQTVRSVTLRAWGIACAVFAAILALSLVVGYEPRIRVRASADDHPNVIFFVVDTLRAKSMGLYGYDRDTTPFIDADAAENAMVFDGAYVQTTFSTPSHTSLYSGCYPFNHRTYHNGARIPDEVILVSQKFKEAGYHTAAFHNHVFLGVNEAFDKGFDTFVETHEPRLNKTRPLVWRYELHLVRAVEVVFRRETVRTLLFDWLEDPPQPFFLWLHTSEPHHSYKPPERLWRKFYDGDYHGEMDGEFSHSVDYATETDADDLAYMIARYDGEIAWMDENYDRLIRRLEELGVERNTLVVLTSDHGEALGEHGIYFRHGQLYQESIWVPLVFRMPGTIPVGRVRQSVESVDIAATLLRLANIQEDAGFCDGRDLSPLWSAPGEEWPPAFAWRSDAIAAIDEDAKLIIQEYPDGQRELYDLESDPDELVNVAAQMPEQSLRLERAINELCESSEKAVVGCFAAGEDDESLSEATLQKLRSLGYVE